MGAKRCVSADNPYQSPTAEEAEPLAPGLSLGQCVWKYAQLGASLAFLVLGPMAAIVAVGVLVHGLTEGIHDWNRGIAILATALGFFLMLTVLCGIVGGVIGLVAYCFGGRT